MGRNREHIVRLCLAPELRMALIKLQAEKEVGDAYALLQLITKGLYQEKKISREVYEVLMQRYSRKLVPPLSEPKLIGLGSKEQQKSAELRRWFESVKAEFFVDHRPLASGKSWRDYVLSEAEKYKDKVAYRC